MEDGFDGLMPLGGNGSGPPPVSPGLNEVPPYVCYRTDGGLFSVYGPAAYFLGAQR